MKHPINTSRLLAEIVAAIAVAETVVMMVLPNLAQSMSESIGVVMDVAILSLLAGPIILWRVLAATRRVGENLSMEEIPRSGRLIFGITAGVTAGLALTGAAVWSEIKGTRQQARTRFDRLSERMVNQLNDRVCQALDGLNGACGLYAASKCVERGDFKNFITKIDLRERFPGIHGIGFIQPVKSTDFNAFVAAQRADGSPDFPIKVAPLDPSAGGGVRDLYMVKFIEPLEENRTVQGMDFAADTSLRESLESAMQTGKPAMTRRVTLTQDPLHRPACVLFMPVYRNGSNPVTLEDRRRDLAGWIYAPFVIDDVMSGISASIGSRLSIDIFDGTDISRETQLFDNDGCMSTATDAEEEEWKFLGRMFHASNPMTVGGRTWTIVTSTTPNFDAEVNWSTPLILGVSGTLLTLLAAGIAWSMGTSRTQALVLARRMTADLSAAKVTAERLAEIARRTSNGVLILDPKGRIEWLNEGFTRQNGYTLAEVAGKTPGEFLHGPLTDQRVVARLAEATSRGEAATAELYNYSKDGRPHLLNIEVEPLRNEAGTLTGFMAIETDITARRKAEAGLAQTTEMLERTGELAQVGGWSVNLQTMKLSWTLQTFRIAEIEPPVEPDLEGGINLFAPEARPVIAAAVQAAIDTGTPYDLEVPLITAKGRHRWVKTQGYAEMRDGQAFRIYGTFQDITARKLAEEQVAESDARFRTLVEHSPYCIHEIDLAGRLVSMNAAGLKMMGVKDERAIFNMPYLDAVGNSDKERIACALADALAGKSSEFVFQASNGLEFQSAFVPITDQSGKVQRLMGLTIDITARKQAEAALASALKQAEAANKAKSEFLANMSHEIRTPLTAILGFTDLLREDGNIDIAPESRLQTIDTIKNAGSHLLTVINDILDLSKVEAEKMTVERIKTPLVSILCEVESLMRPRAMGKGVSLKAVLATPLPEYIVSDPTRLRQILMNIAGNAVKFTEAGAITITSRADNQNKSARLLIDIEDSGPGMTVEEAARLFNAFAQSDASVTRKHGGTGLGLTICRRLSTLMGGSVTLLWSELGRGSCFRVDLPLDISPGSRLISCLDAVETAETPAASHDVRLNGRILLAEDGVDNQRLIAFHLRKAGATVEIADNGRIALEMLRNSADKGTPFDLLLTDMQMPEMDGYTLARTLRERGSTLAIIALTAHAMTEDRAKCIDAGCDDYASKPIDKVLLLTACATWMGKSGGVCGHSQAA